MRSLNQGQTKKWESNATSETHELKEKVFDGSVGKGEDKTD